MNKKSTSRIIGTLGAAAMTIVVAGGCDTGEGIGGSGTSKKLDIISKFTPKGGFGTSSKRR